MGLYEDEMTESVGKHIVNTQDMLTESVTFNP